MTTTAESPVIDCSEHHDLLNELRATLPSVPRRDLKAYFAAALEASKRLPADLVRRLTDFRDNGNEDGYLLLRGLPREADLPETPNSTPAPVDRPLLASEAWLALVGRVLGLPTGYHDCVSAPSTTTSALTGCALPVVGDLETLLEFHTEMAYHQHQPQYVMLAVPGPTTRTGGDPGRLVRRAIQLIDEDKVPLDG